MVADAFNSHSLGLVNGHGMAVMVFTEAFCGTMLHAKRILSMDVLIVNVPKEADVTKV